MDSLFANNREGLNAEFAALEEFADALSQDSGLWYTAQLPCNQVRNRYNDILANEPTRVRLASQPGGSDYINANFIDGSTFGTHHVYIAAQGPMPHTIEHWWMMIWEQQVSTIVMLANVVERGDYKVHPYWPQATGMRRAQRFGPFTVSMSVENTDHGFPELVRRILTLQCDGSPEVRTINQWHFTGWPDHGVPQSPAALSHLLSLADSQQPTGPLLVHCSAGVGRSGVLITAHIVCSNLKRYFQAHGDTAGFQFNLVGTICQLRRSRNQLVQTPSQLGLCYTLISNEVDRLMWHASSSNSPKVPFPQPCSPARSRLSPSPGPQFSGVADGWGPGWSPGGRVPEPQSPLYPGSVVYSPLAPGSPSMPHSVPLSPGPNHKSPARRSSSQSPLRQSKLQSLVRHMVSPLRSPV
eukprot:EG_transcript_8110